MIAQSFRYWLADLITGGEIRRMDDIICKLARRLEIKADLYAGDVHTGTLMVGSLANALAEAKSRAERLQSDLDIISIDNTNGWHNSKHFESALRTIAAMPTPKANATVRRMASVAREAVKP